MAEFSLRLACAAGCLDQVAERLDAAGTRLESLACLSQEGNDGVVTFSLAETKGVRIEAAAETGSSTLQIKVANRAGCLSEVTSALGKAGVTINSLACACAADDASGIVAVGLQPRG